MMNKTLGGERLGAGGKMKVGLHGYERSTHDLSYLFKTTMAPGTLVPFMWELGLPGDSFDINLNAKILTLPTIGPLFGTYKVQLDVFKANIRLYQGTLNMNKLGIGRKMETIPLPLMCLFAFKSATSYEDIDNAQINPSCILSYMDIRGIGLVTTAATTAFPRFFTALKLLMYWDTYKNYYANKQEEVGYVIHTERPAINPITSLQVGEIGGGGVQTLPQAPSIGSIPLAPGMYAVLNYSGSVPNAETIMVLQDNKYVPILDLFYYNQTTGSQVELIYKLAAVTTIDNWRYINAADALPVPPTVQMFPLEEIDDMRANLLGNTGLPTAFRVDQQNKKPYNYLLGDGTTPNSDYETSYTLNQEGLGIKTYQSDLFNNWLLTESIDGPDSISAITSVSTAGGSFSIDTLNLAKKLYDMFNRIQVSGNSYDDWLDAVYAHERTVQPTIPIYCGGLIKELIFEEVVSNTETTDQPLGTLAGRGVMGDKHKGGNISIKCDEPCYIYGIISITPRLDYSQGNKWDNTFITVNDFHKPALDGIGFQTLLTNQMAWWADHNFNNTPNGAWTSKRAGYQPAWINYTTNVNKTRGNFAIENNSMFMTLNRRYEKNPVSHDIQDLTTYIDPVKFNQVFAQTSLDAQNFWTQIACNITARRKMSARQIPNL